MIEKKVVKAGSGLALYFDTKDRDAYKIEHGDKVVIRDFAVIKRDANADFVEAIDLNDEVMKKLINYMEGIVEALNSRINKLQTTLNEQQKNIEIIQAHAKMEY